MPRILIAEDEPDIRALIDITLKFGGFDVVTVADGQAAVESATARRPDLILLDVRMPRMTGYEACRALKANPATADIPIVFLSAKGQEDEVRSGLTAGARDYILKPFAPEELIKHVGRLLAESAPPPAAASTEAPEPAASNGKSPAARKKTVK